MSEEHRVLGTPRKRPREVWGDRDNRICTHPCPRIARLHSPLERDGGTERGAHALRLAFAAVALCRHICAPPGLNVLGRKKREPLDVTGGKIKMRTVG